MISIVKKIFFTKDKKFVIIQSPNLPLVLAAIFWVLRFITTSDLGTISVWGTRFWLGYWAFLEIGWGVNVWRRLLGLGVLVWVGLGFFI